MAKGDGELDEQALWQNKIYVLNKTLNVKTS